METYLHINNTNPNWKIGDEILFGEEDNNYWKSISQRDESFSFEGKKHEAFKVLNAAYEHYEKIQPAPSIMKGYHFNHLQSLNETIQCLRNSININRELILETVRKESYPNLPSRQKCIWLIPDNNRSLSFWNSILQKGNGKKLYRVELIGGIIHRASQEWLVGGTYSINHWHEMAQNYWEGMNSGNIQDEVLYEGKIKIIEEKTLPNRVDGRKR